MNDAAGQRRYLNFSLASEGGCTMWGMIEHTGISVRDAKKAKAFYAAALRPLGYKVKYDFSDAAGFMEGGHTSFWIGKTAKFAPMHVAFRAKSKKAVRDFYAAALKAGGKDNGAPGPRPDYSPDYWAAFVLDLDGNNIEAVYYDKKAVGRKRKAARKK